MKKFTPLMCFLILVLSGLSANAQKYRSVADTGKLNMEYVKVSNDIADLTLQLTEARNTLASYQSKSKTAGSNADDAAVSSSDQASKATGGDVGDARSAKRKAKKALREAKDARSADKNVKNQEDKISRLSAQLKKKQSRLQELDAMRIAINKKI